MGLESCDFDRTSIHHAEANIVLTGSWFPLTSLLAGQNASTASPMSGPSVVRLREAQQNIFPDWSRLIFRRSDLITKNDVKIEMTVSNERSTGFIRRFPSRRFAVSTTRHLFEQSPEASDPHGTDVHSRGMRCGSVCVIFPVHLLKAHYSTESAENKNIEKQRVGRAPRTRSGN